MAKTSRGVLIAGNWKMNHGPAETERFFSLLRSEWGKTLSQDTRDLIRDRRVTILVTPPYLSLERARAAADGLPVEIGAQNAHWEKTGAYTGEVSAPMLREIGIEWSLIGHSERRQYFGETDETVRKRTEALLANELWVVLCVGETREEYEAGQRQEVLKRQLSAVFAEKDKGSARYLDGRLVIAYEPVWAIGTGLTATPEEAQSAHAYIRGFLRDGFGDAAANKTLLLYGGSVKPDNIEELLACPDVDGALVGGASLKPDDFLKLVEAGGRKLGQ